MAMLAKSHSVRLTHKPEIRVNVKGTITLGNATPKQVIKRNGNAGLVKEDCVAEETGH